MATELMVVGQDGVNEIVSNGMGLGIKQHDDVMLQYGYSRSTRVSKTIPSGEFLIIRLDINEPTNLQHHVEDRFVSTYDSSVNFKVVEVSNDGEFPASPIPMIIRNKNGVAVETPGVNVKAEFNTYAVQATNPITLNDANTVDDLNIYASAGQGNQASTEGAFASAKGRHYDVNKTYAVIFENIGLTDTFLQYIYDWHEY